MIADLDELIYTQVVYVTILALILWFARRKRKERIVYWSIAAVYAFIIGWLIYVYFSFGDHPDSGSVFGWAMISITLPGVLVLIAAGVFVVARMVKK